MTGKAIVIFPGFPGAVEPAFTENITSLDNAAK